MKLAISGKGGTGKTTLAGILAHLYREDGYNVLAVDADPDANLAAAIGIPWEWQNKIRPISEQRHLIKERTGATPREFGQLFKLNPRVSDIPDDYGIDFQGIRLLVMGAVQKGGEGCACPENVLLKSLLSEIILHRNEVVIVDMEAGIEHLGRATAESIDKMLICIEPGSRSLDTAKAIMRLGKEIGIQDFGIVGNKIRNKNQESWIRTQFATDIFLGFLPYSKTIQEADIQQKPLFDVMGTSLSKAFNKIYQQLL
ncbi:MAG: AAA family ATPase [Candidatus Aminicenantes bacterium]|nr:MAG: AAA family ATPase [Candidatus Aminicenantes bacterium]